MAVFAHLTRACARLVEMHFGASLVREKIVICLSFLSGIQVWSMHPGSCQLLHAQGFAGESEGDCVWCVSMRPVELISMHISLFACIIMETTVIVFQNKYFLSCKRKAVGHGCPVFLFPVQRDDGSVGWI